MLVPDRSWSVAGIYLKPDPAFLNQDQIAYSDTTELPPAARVDTLSPLSGTNGPGLSFKMAHSHHNRIASRYPLSAHDRRKGKPVLYLEDAKRHAL